MTLDPEVELLLREAVRKDRRSLEEVINRALRKGLATRPSKTKRPQYRLKARKLGIPSVDLTKASMLSAELEDAELIQQIGGRR
ncbi:MAG: hypothetical protein ACKV2Q_20035 [Planctomycetaceae bacterium]